MNTVSFIINGVTKNSYTDFGLTLKPREYNFPTPKIKKIQIEGKSGSIDLSEVLTGEMEYEDRQLPLEFNVVDAVSTWNSKLTTIVNFLHGKSAKIVFTNDSGYYFLGRCVVNKMASDKNIGTLTVDCEVDPYKYKTNKTTSTTTVNGTATITLVNARMSVVPKITTTAAITFTFEGNLYSINGTTTIPSIQLKQGNNVFTVTSGTGNITFEYQEADL